MVEWFWVQAIQARHGLSSIDGKYEEKVEQVKDKLFIIYSNRSWFSVEHENFFSAWIEKPTCCHT